MISSIFFDFDGVLTLDHSGSEAIAKNIQKIHPHLEVFDIQNAYRKTFEHNHHTGFKSLRDGWSEFMQVLTIVMPEEDMESAIRTVRLNEEMLELAQELSEQYTLGIITDNDSERMRMVDIDHNLTNLFPHFLVSGDLGYGKFDGTVHIYDLALETVHAEPSEVLFIDNKAKNLATPEGMGIHVYWHDDRENNVGELRKKMKELEIL